MNNWRTLINKPKTYSMLTCVMLIFLFSLSLFVPHGATWLVLCMHIRRNSTWGQNKLILRMSVSCAPIITTIRDGAIWYNGKQWIFYSVLTILMVDPWPRIFVWPGYGPLFFGSVLFQRLLSNPPLIRPNPFDNFTFYFLNF
jgi:hypothetical protein